MIIDLTRSKSQFTLINFIVLAILTFSSTALGISTSSILETSSSSSSTTSEPASTTTTTWARPLP